MVLTHREAPDLAAATSGLPEFDRLRSLLARPGGSCKCRGGLPDAALIGPVAGMCARASGDDRLRQALKTRWPSERSFRISMPGCQIEI
jgi:hypothetical protein